MADRSFLDWPFFEPRHRELAAALDAWCAANLPVDHADTDAACIGLVRMLGEGGWLEHSTIDPDRPGDTGRALTVPDPRDAGAP
jgi:acyl-CoA dehydrogenase